MPDEVHDRMFLNRREEVADLEHPTMVRLDPLVLSDYDDLIQVCFRFHRRMLLAIILNDAGILLWRCLTRSMSISSST